MWSRLIKIDLAMLTSRRAVFALLLILAVAVVFIAPSVQLEPTALRAWLAASAFFLAMAALCHVVSGPFLFDPLSIDSHGFKDVNSSSIQSPSLDLDCVRIC